MIYQSPNFGAATWYAPKTIPLFIGIQQQISKINHFTPNREQLTNPLIKYMTRLLTIFSNNNVIEKDIHEAWVDEIIPRVPLCTFMFSSAALRNVTNRNIFIEGETLELYIPTTGLLANSSINLESPWEMWKDIRPIRLTYLDSGELPLEWYHRILFKIDEPTVAVFTIDTEALLTQYIIYLRHHGYDYTFGTLSDFVYRTILPGIRKDLVDLWVIRSLKDGILEEATTFIPEIDFISSTAIARFEQHIDDVSTKLSRGNISFTKYINCIYNGKSISDMIDSVGYTRTLISRPLGLAYLAHANYDNFILSALTVGTVPDKESERIKQFRVFYDRLKRTIYTLNPHIKPLVNTLLEEIGQKLNTSPR